VEGTDRWVLVRLNPYRDASDQQRGVVVTFVDITELKGAQGMQQSILDSLLEHVAVIDGDGVIVHVNEAWRSFAEENGAPPGASSFDGSNYLEICRAAADDGDQDAALVAERLDALLSGRIPHFSLEYPCHAPDEDRWFLMYASRIRERDGGAVVSHIDITARKRAEDSGRAAQSGDAGNGEGPGGRGADQPDGPEGR
jgi:two-component system CheB/CheR fusion protein